MEVFPRITTSTPPPLLYKPYKHNTHTHSHTNNVLRRLLFMTYQSILTFGFGYIEIVVGSNKFGRFDEGFPCFAHGCESHQGFHRKSW
ncbi:hypothetical protein ACJIZ3_023496 [Penstemon smallii]|uniref:Uncharacterized protein n=1 Tax=Penstemon smallii TaxID=265156 RepID=A0ABD3TQ99_9LAMI